MEGSLGEVRTNLLARLSSGDGSHDIQNFDQSRPAQDVPQIDLITALRAVASTLSPEQRIDAELAARSVAEFVPAEQKIGRYGGAETNIRALYDEYDLETLIAARGWNGVGFPLPPGVRTELLVRQKLLTSRKAQETEFDAVYAAIRRDLGIDHESTYLARALRALLEGLQSGNPEDIAVHIRDYVIAVLNPRRRVHFWNITDVNGVESEVGATNDYTRPRIAGHRRQLQNRYGVELEVEDVEASIECPEQCGAFVLWAINQARRIDTGDTVKPWFVVLNNAARIPSEDGIIDGLDEAQTSGLFYFTFDLGDGVLHRGLAYGLRTLVHLKRYIRELFEIPKKRDGSQFRSLEHEHHVAVNAAIADGHLPVCWPVTRLSPEELIPELDLQPHEWQYLGIDKYGNGIVAANAEDVFDEFLPPDQAEVEVLVTFLYQFQY